jgi:hypothetical protein
MTEFPDDDLEHIFSRAEAERNRAYCLSASLIEMTTGLTGFTTKIPLKELHTLIGGKEDGMVPLTQVLIAVDKGCNVLTMEVSALSIHPSLRGAILIPDRFTNQITYTADHIETKQPHILIRTPAINPDFNYHAETNLNLGLQKPEFMNDFLMNWLPRLCIDFQSK